MKRFCRPNKRSLARLLLWPLVYSTAAHASLFDAETPLSLQLEGPLRQLIHDSGEDEYPFTLRSGDNEFDVAIRVRSQSRRQICDFPPLRLNFKRAQTEGSVFAGQDKLKLVTHCKAGHSYEANILEEYNAYRILNLITPVSFRVRLLRMTYLDGRRSQEKWAFLIEDVDALAERVGGEHFEPAFAQGRELEQRHATQVALFQFLIGNTDFSLTAPKRGRSCCHNAKLIRTPAALYSVPYDFDQSGLVNAAYAGANPVMNVRNVKTRHYRGFCVANDILEAAIATILPRRSDIDALFTTTPGLTQREANRATKYLHGFYDRAEKRGIRDFAKDCL